MASLLLGSFATVSRVSHYGFPAMFTRASEQDPTVGLLEDAQIISALCNYVALGFAPSLNTKTPLELSLLMSVDLRLVESLCFYVIRRKNCHNDLEMTLRMYSCIGRSVSIRRNAYLMWERALRKVLTGGPSVGF